VIKVVSKTAVPRSLIMSREPRLDKVPQAYQLVTGKDIDEQRINNNVHGLTESMEYWYVTQSCLCLLIFLNNR
jgi:hypothetical protein